MGTARKFDLDGSPDAYFATLRSSSRKEALKRCAANWQIYAAVTGSALAMAAGASAAMIGNGVQNIVADPAASARMANQPLASSGNTACDRRLARSYRQAGRRAGSRSCR